MTPSPQLRCFRSQAWILGGRPVGRKPCGGFWEVPAALGRRKVDVEWRIFDIAQSRGPL